MEGKFTHIGITDQRGLGANVFVYQGCVGIGSGGHIISMLENTSSYIRSSLLKEALEAIFDSCLDALQG